MLVALPRGISESERHNEKIVVHTSFCQMELSRDNQTVATRAWANAESFLEHRSTTFQAPKWLTQLLSTPKSALLKACRLSGKAHLRVISSARGKLSSGTTKYRGDATRTCHGCWSHRVAVANPGTVIIKTTRLDLKGQVLS